MIKNITILSAIFCLLLMSCSDSFLDRQPLDQVASSNFYKTEEDAKEALVAVYDALQYQSSPNVSWAPFLTVSDILSDDAYGGGGDANDGANEDELNQFRVPTNNSLVHSIWLKNYVGIYRANLLLEKIGDIEASDEFKTRIIAECKFLRAYFYTELIRFFENIPLLTQTISGPSEYSQTQNPTKEVYDQIGLDLVEAMEDLPTFLPASENGRVTKWAAQGLLARVFLFYNGVYGDNIQAGTTLVDRAKALSYLEDMIANSGLQLHPVYGELFKLSTEFGVESVFEISYGDSPAWWDWGYVRGAEGNLAAQMQGPRVTDSDAFDRGWSFATVSETLNQFMGDDPRNENTILRQEELDGNLGIGYQHTGYYSKKYTSDAEHWGSDGQFEHNRTCNFRVIRFADVLLMAAELGSPSAQGYLDDVRQRVGLTSIPATMENILNERRLELSLEGIRYFDILRQGMDYANQELTVEGVRGPNYEGDQILFDVQFNSASKGFLPIPQTEIDLSGGTFMQNAGY